MSFDTWLNLQESNLNDLYVSTVNAFPNTTKRQHSIDPVDIVEINWTPFMGVNTLFIKALAHSGESGKEYNTYFLFKNVKYNESSGIQILDKNGQKYFFDPLSMENDVLVRCSCPDFSWRFNYTDHLDRSLYGVKRKKYEAINDPGSSNPLELPGMCKHLIKLAKTLTEIGVIGV